MSLARPKRSPLLRSTLTSLIGPSMPHWVTLAGYGEVPLGRLPGDGVR